VKGKKMLMKKLKIAIMAGALGLAVEAHASLYDITFSATDGSGVTAIGTLDVNSFGVATGGSLDVSGGANPGDYTLLAQPSTPGSYAFDPSSPPHASFDDLVFPGSNPFLNQASIYGGLVWENAGDTVGFKMFYNTPAYAAVLNADYGVPTLANESADQNEYALWGWNTSGPFGYGPQSFGSATLTAVPEPTTIIAGVLLLLPFGTSTLRILRRNRAA
jgi:hypothetical protein